MIFHAPYPVQEGPSTGSAVRPGRIRQGFLDLGYRIFDFTGDGKTRQGRLRQLKDELKAGTRFEFCYGENSTMPTVLTESHHLPTHPIVDMRLLHLLRQHQVPTGMFYRDIYWRFPEYTERVNPVIAAGTRTLYHAELLGYRRLLDRVYLPSDRIADYVPHLRPGQPAALPPGGFVHDVPRTDQGSGASELTLLYVGNISPYYRMHELFRAVAEEQGVKLILCTPQDSWATVRGEYDQWVEQATGRIEVVHRSGDGLTELFGRADLCALVVEPSEYRDFAAPVKLFEYVGYGKPVLVSAGTHAADLVTTDDLGWAVNYNSVAVRDLLIHLRDHPEAVRDATEQVRSARHRHTWQARAGQVESDLGGIDARRPVS